MQTIQIVKKVNIPEPIMKQEGFREDDMLWLPAGTYSIRREFDDDRYIIETGENEITLVNKNLTIPIY